MGEHPVSKLSKDARIADLRAQVEELGDEVAYWRNVADGRLGEIDELRAELEQRRQDTWRSHR